MAPRPVLLSNATGDIYSDPWGTFYMGQAAEPVYRLFGVDRFAVKEMPKPGELAVGRIGYYLRTGRHSVNHEDVEAFLDFSDHFLQKPPKKLTNGNSSRQQLEEQPPEKGEPFK
jgi:hypothetical protein